MKQGSTFILRAAVVLGGLIVLSLCVFALPVWINSDVTGAYKPILVGLYVTAVPFFIALYQTMKLLQYVDKNTVFSAAAVRALRYIKYCAVLISAMFAAGMPYIFNVADRDDAPGVVLIGLFVVIASFIIATATAVLQKLIQSAIGTKRKKT